MSSICQKMYLRDGDVDQIYFNDCLERTVLSLIPVIGAVMFFFNAVRANELLDADFEDPFTVDDFKDKIRRYTLLALGSDLMAAAGVISGLAMGILSSGVAFPILGILGLHTLFQTFFYIKPSCLLKSVEEPVYTLEVPDLSLPFKPSLSLEPPSDSVAYIEK